MDHNELIEEVERLAEFARSMRDEAKRDADKDRARGHDADATFHNGRYAAYNTVSRHLRKLVEKVNEYPDGFDTDPTSPGYVPVNDPDECEHRWRNYSHYGGDFIKTPVVCRDCGTAASPEVTKIILDAEAE